MSDAYRTNGEHYLAKHPAGHASTVRDAAPLDTSTKHRNQVAEYGGVNGQTRFRVLHDPLAHPPYGLHRVYAGERQIGAQLSMPSHDDCRRMDSTPRDGAAGPNDAVALAYTQRLGKRRAERLAKAAEQRAATGTKPCAMCRKELELAAFRQLTDGRRHSYCKPCCSERETARSRSHTAQSGPYGKESA